MGAEKLKTPYERIGGRDKILEIAKIFYDKVYEDPWISQYFQDIPQEHIENQQADFMSGSFNGPKLFCGRLPNDAHPHMVITDELFDHRRKLLEQALAESGIEEDLQKIWLKIDDSFRNSIVNPDPEKAKKRYHTDTILNFPKPR